MLAMETQIKTNYVPAKETQVKNNYVKEKTNHQTENTLNNLIF